MSLAGIALLIALDFNPNRPYRGLMMSADWTSRSSIVLDKTLIYISTVF